MQKDFKMKICFITGLMQRSGTNYLHRLISKHPLCLPEQVLKEDNLIRRLPHIEHFLDDLFDDWNPNWEVELKRINKDHFRKSLMKTILETLFESHSSDVGKVLVSKTPSTENIELFKSFFTDQNKLIVLIRDGRSVITSGIDSFNWNFESSSRLWAQRARNVAQFRESCDHNQVKFVKYENLIDKERRNKELYKIFEFLNLDHSLYPFDEDIPIIGSSELVHSDGLVHWKETKNHLNFSPLTRYHSWGWYKKTRFAYIAQVEMYKMGYDIDAISTWQKCLNHLLDSLLKKPPRLY